MASLRPFQTVTLFPFQPAGAERISDGISLFSPLWPAAWGSDGIMHLFCDWQHQPGVRSHAESSPRHGKEAGEA